MVTMNDLKCCFDREETVLHRLEQILTLDTSIVVLSMLTLLPQKLAFFVIAQATKGLQRPLRAWRCDLIMLTLLANLPAVYAQQPPASVVSQGAISIINTAIKPIGDEKAIRSLDSCLVTGAVKQGEKVGTFTWKSAAQEHWSETNVDSIDTVTASNHGKPMRLTGSKKSEIPVSTLANPIPTYHVGLSLLHSRDDAAVAVVASAATATTGATIQINQAKPKDPDIEAAYEIWTLDPQTGLPASHLFKPTVYRGRAIGMATQYKFSNYSVVLGVNVPRHIEQYANEQLIRSFDLESFQCGIGFSGTDFEVNGGGL